MRYFIKEDLKAICDQIVEQIDSLSGKKVLLTGAGGFLGRYITEVIRQSNLSDRNISVTLVDNFIVSGSHGNFFKSVETDLIKVSNVDICNLSDVLTLGTFDLIVHAAGIASPYYYRAKPLPTLEVSTKGTQNLLELARKSSARFSFFSSSEVYGDPDPNQIPIKESYRGNVSSMGPRACYDESKRLGETLCYVYHEYYGVSSNVIRPFNVYGPGMQENDYRVMPNFGSRIKAGKPLEIYGSGSQTRTFCYITDAIVGFFKVFCDGVPGEPYNVGNPDPEVSVAKLGEIFQSQSNRDVVLKKSVYPDSYPQDEPNRRCPDITKIQKQLQFFPKVNLEVGVSKFLEWAMVAYDGQQGGSSKL